jgi:phytol kinase
MLTVLAAAAALQAAFLVLLGGLSRAANEAAVRPETSRKLLHTGAGVLTLALPFVFHDVWPIVLLTGSNAAVLAAIRFVPAVRARFGAAAYRVDRSTFGEFYFLASVPTLFWLTQGQSPLLFVIPILILTLADATSALVGARYGLTPYSRAHKTLEGSLAFAAVGFLCVHVPLLLWTSVGRAESLLIAATLALLVTLLEASVWRGRDNLLIPIGGYLLLRHCLTLTTEALALRLAAASFLFALVGLYVVLAHRRRGGQAPAPLLSRSSRLCVRESRPWTESSRSLPTPTSRA